jgi:Tfp pilus assembly protein PilZ
MAPPQARRSERIDYSAEVELLAPIDSDAPRRVLGQAVDLGSGGMRVTTESTMPIGAQVTCRVMLDGKPASLPGRVVWRSDAAADSATNLHGMGICFEPLGTYENGLLKHVVERSVAGYRAVELLFPGLDEPVVARARTRTNGLRLSAALPIFARNTELSFQLDEEGPVLTAVIGNAVLQESEDGTRRIDIEVDVTEPEETGRYRRRARYGYPVELEAEPLRDMQRDLALAPTEPGTRSAITVERASRAQRRRGYMLPMLGAAVAGGALAWLAASVLLPRASWDADEAFVARPRPPEQLVGHIAQVVQPVPEHVTPVAPPTPSPAVTEIVADTTNTPARSVTEPPNAVTARPATQVSVRSTLHAEPAAVTMEAAVASTSEAVVDESADEATAAAPDIHVIDANGDALAAQPEIVLEAEATRVRIPFAGSLENMQALLWAEPLALAIDLPHGNTALAQGRYSIGAGGITDLRVNKRADALLIRVKLSSPITRYSITAEDGMLEARLEALAPHSP